MSTLSRPRTRRLRVPLAVLGAVAFAVGLVTVVAPGVGGAVPIEPVLALLGNDFTVVAVFAIGALLVLLVALVARGVNGIDQATPPDPEDVHNVPIFGAEFDDFVSGGGVGALLGADRHEEIRTRLREAATATVMRESNCTRAEARERIERGEWTDDPAVASFLAGAAESGPRRTAQLGLAGRLRAALGGNSPFQQTARRTAAEIVDYGSRETR